MSRAVVEDGPDKLKLIPQGIQHLPETEALLLATLLWRSHGALAAENLFLRKQLAMFQERKAEPHRATDPTRFLMALLGRFFDWRSALVVVKPDTLIRWHGKGFGLLWRWKSRPRGRPKLHANLRELIREMAADSPTWGEARIADELLLKLDDLRPQSRPGHGGLRFLCGRGGRVSRPPIPRRNGLSNNSERHCRGTARIAL